MRPAVPPQPSHTPGCLLWHLLSRDPWVATNVRHEKLQTAAGNSFQTPGIKLAVSTPCTQAVSRSAADSHGLLMECDAPDRTLSSHSPERCCLQHSGLPRLTPSVNLTTGASFLPSVSALSYSALKGLNHLTRVLRRRLIQLQGPLQSFKQSWHDHSAACSLLRACLGRQGRLWRCLGGNRSSLPSLDARHVSGTLISCLQELSDEMMMMQSSTAHRCERSVAASW